MSFNSKSARWGLTLIEILVALVMTLIVLGAMMFAFRYASTEIARGRAVMELSNRLRTAQNLIRTDTDGVTVDVRPWSKTAGPNGYFELIEGPSNDLAPGADAPGNSVVGDVDDILAMTVRSADRPFRGRLGNEIIESDIAEVIWWTSFEDNNNNGRADFDETVSLHRRALLVRPDLDLSATPISSGADIEEFFLVNDVSARFSGRTMLPNSLADLAKRENRFARNAVYPHRLEPGRLSAFQMSSANLAPFIAGNPELRGKAGDDIVLTDVIGFDLQVFSPDTPILSTDGVALEPDDVGYSSASDIGGQGAYVDLGYTGAPFNPNVAQPQFSTRPTLQSGFTDVAYDTFSTHYETDGESQLNPASFDQGFDGIDNNNVNGVDDNTEREVLPPYPFRLLGMKTTLRVVERKSQQIRQVEVISNFVPQ